MKVLVDIGHPAHVHFFKNAIWKLESEGHQVQITARDKEIALYLLDVYGFYYHDLGKNQKGLLKKGIYMLKIDFEMYKVVKKFNPDVLMGIHNPYIAQVSKLSRKPSLIYTDTEHAKFANNLTFPFATVNFTPSCFKKDLGSKQIRYNGYHELAYLHPDYFTPDPSVLDELELKEGERFIILRFVAWGASHDGGHKGISMELRRRFVRELEKYGRILITSESELPAEFEPYRMKLAPEKMHDLLYYAALYVGEGGTMATEAGILGTPSIYISSLVGSMGNFEELENKYGLVYSFRDPLSAIDDIFKILKNNNSKDEWKVKRKILLDETIDVTSFIVKNIKDKVKI
ncbi:MAG: DUF354 domain-containing protein [ANME-2 cluster archaeon]|nr:DUF354 domain-containing protein [ANME-2 cluster archaeon]